MDNINKVLVSGMCTGCGACNVCENISFRQGMLGFPIPVVNNNCTSCGKCLSMCIYDPERDDD